MPCFIGLLRPLYFIEQSLSTPHIIYSNYNTGYAPPIPLLTNNTSIRLFIVDIVSHLFYDYNISLYITQRTVIYQYPSLTSHNRPDTPHVKNLRIVTIHYKKHTLYAFQESVTTHVAQYITFIEYTIYSALYMIAM